MKKIKILIIWLMIFSIFTPSFSHVCINVDDSPRKEEYIIGITNILNVVQGNEQLWMGGGDKQWIVDVELEVIKVKVGNEGEIKPRNKGTVYLYNGGYVGSDAKFPKNREILDKFLNNSLWIIYSKENNDKNTVIQIGKDSYLPCQLYIDHKLNDDSENRIRKRGLEMKDYCYYNHGKPDGYAYDCEKMPHHSFFQIDSEEQ
ncbi:MAG: hypothetical protein ACRCXK_03280 [Wohlfahrtiimonas sp.]